MFDGVGFLEILPEGRFKHLGLLYALTLRIISPTGVYMSELT
jgi:hypothetical protein